ncbi:hypothetical protein K492DRAFT_233138 [Lichtheimia hyalospora FSU 10163]|nr:hypothetical protein K492DRAFT_233138 [Lichtheimia hyalospora FSU 10163]
MEEEKAPTRFTLCNDQQCCKRFNYLDFATVHTFIDGPDPRDHFANERNTLIWLRTGMILALIGFMTMLDLRTKVFAPSQSLPWTEQVDSIQVRAMSYAFIALGIITICVGVRIYMRNLHQIVNRYLTVGHGWIGYTTATVIMLFAIVIMSLALSLPKASSFSNN